MRGRVRQKTHMVHEHQSGGACVEHATLPVTPSKASHESRNHKSHHDQKTKIPLVLPPDYRTLAKVGNVSKTGLATGFNNHPADVGPEQTMVGAVRVELGVGVTMVGTVTTGPPLDGSLNGACACDCEDILQDFGRIVGSMCPEAMVTSSNTWRKVSDNDCHGMKANIPRPVTK